LIDDDREDCGCDDRDAAHAALREARHVGDREMLLLRTNEKATSHDLRLR